MHDPQTARLGISFEPTSTSRRFPLARCCGRRLSVFLKKRRSSFRDRKSRTASSTGWSTALPNALSGLGVKKGDRVALYMTNRPEYVISFYAAARLGRRGHADESHLQEERDPAPAQRTPKPAFWSCRSRSIRWSNRCAQRCPSLKEVIIVGRNAEAKTHLFRRPHPGLVREAPAASGPELDRGPGGPALLQRHHRPAQGRHAEPAESGGQQHPVHLQRTHIGARHPAHLPALLPHLRHDAWSAAASTPALPWSSWRRSNLDLSLALAQQHKVTLYYAVPPIMVALDNHPNVNQFDLSHMRYIMVGAAPLAPEVGQRVQDKTGVRVLQGYGLTEASPVTHLNPVDQGCVKLDSGRPGGAEPGAEDRRPHHRRAGTGHRRRRRVARQRPPTS